MSWRRRPSARSSASCTSDLVGLSGIAPLEASLPTSGRPLPSPTVLLLISVVGTVIASFSANALAGNGEAIGWRGYLLPPSYRWVVTARTSSSGSYGPSGTPRFVLLGYDYDDAGRVTALLALTVFCILFGTLLVWLRNRSDSLTGQAASAG